MNFNRNITYEEIINELESEEDYEISWWTGGGEGGFDTYEGDEESSHKDIIHFLQNIIMEGLYDNGISSHAEAEGVFLYDSSNKTLFCKAEYGENQELGTIPPGQTKDVYIDIRTYFDRLSK